MRICLLHFLRDLGKDLMQDLHTDLGIMINRAGIKSEIRAILRELPEYHTASLLELEDGFCSDREKMEIMGIRRILETFQCGETWIVDCTRHISMRQCQE